MRILWLLLALASTAIAQETLTLSGPLSSSIVIGTSATLTLTSAGTATGPAALQWTLVVPSGVTVTSATVGAVATAAGKSLSCDAPNINCLIAGLNSNVLADGVVATLTVFVPLGTTPGPGSFALTNVVAADKDALGMSISPSTLVPLLLLLATPGSAAITNVTVETTPMQAILSYTAPDASACVVLVYDMNLPVRISSASQTSGLVTVQTHGLAHGFKTGDIVWIENTGVAGWDNANYAVGTVPTANSFTFGNANAGSSTHGTVGALVHDTDNALFPGSNLDSRAGTVINGRRRSFIAGKKNIADVASDGWRYSRALQVFSRHHYLIACSSDIAEGEFSTANIPLGNADMVGVMRSHPTDLGQNPNPQFDVRGRYERPGNAVMERVIDPTSGIQYTNTMVAGEGLNITTLGTHIATPATTGWTAPTNIDGNDGASASYSGTNKDILCIRWVNPTAGTPANYNVDDGSVDSAQVHLVGALSSSTASNDADIEVALKFDGVCADDAGKKTNWITKTLTGSSASYDIPAGNPNNLSTPKIKAAFQDWVNPGAWIPTRVDVVSSLTHVDTNGTSTVLLQGYNPTGNFSYGGSSSAKAQDQSVFLPYWTAGSKIRIGGATDCTGGTEYTIAGVQNPRTLTVTATPATSLNAQACMNNLLLMIRKKNTTANTITIQYANMDFVQSVPPVNDSAGGAKRYSEAPVADSSGNLGYVYQKDENGNFWTSKDTGETRYIMGQRIPGRTGVWVTSPCLSNANTYDPATPGDIICFPDGVVLNTRVPVRVRVFPQDGTVWDTTHPDTNQSFAECITTSPASPNPCIQMTQMTGIYSFGDLIHDLRSEFDTTVFTSCGPSQSIEATYIVIVCDSSQDTTGWIAVFDTSKNIASYTPGAHNGTNPIIGAIYTLDPGVWRTVIHAVGMGGGVVTLALKIGRDNEHGRSGTVTTSGSTVTYISGVKNFAASGNSIAVQPGEIINVNGSNFTVLAQTDPTHVTTTTTVGTNASPVPYYIHSWVRGAGPYVLAISGDAALANSGAAIIDCPANSFGITGHTCSQVTVTSEPYDPSPATGETGAAGEFGVLALGQPLVIMPCADYDTQDGSTCAETAQTAHNYEYVRVLAKSGTAPTILVTFARGTAGGNVPTVGGTVATTWAGGWHFFHGLFSTDNVTRVDDGTVVWDFLNYPIGGPTGAVIFGNKNTSHGSCTKFGCVAPDTSVGVQFNYPFTSVLADSIHASGIAHPQFNNKQGYALGNSVEDYVSNWIVDVPVNDPGFMMAINSRPTYFNFSDRDTQDIAWQLVAGTSYVYKANSFPTNQTWPFWQFKNLPVMMYWRGLPLLNVSGPACALTDTQADWYKYCVVYTAGEGRSGSKRHEVYAIAPYANKLQGTSFSCGTRYLIGEADFCIQHVDPFTSGNVQYNAGLKLDMGRGKHFRKLGSMFGSNRVGYPQFPRVMSDGRWSGAIAMYGVNQLRSTAIMGKIPPVPPLDSYNRLFYLPMEFTVGSAPTGTVAAYIEFGYNDFGSDPATGKFYCSTERRDNCRAVSAAFPPALLSNHIGLPDQVTCNGATPSVCTWANHRLGADSKVDASGPWEITIPGLSSVSLTGSSGITSTYMSAWMEDAPFLFASDGCTVSTVLNVSPIEIVCVNEHKLQTGNRVFVSGVGGTTNANGFYTITVTGNAGLKLNGTTGNGAYTSGGTVAPGGEACASGCTVSVPTRSGQVMYMRWNYLNAAGAVIARSNIRTVATK